MPPGKIDPVFVYTTVETEDQADRLGLALVEQKLAACVNIMPNIKSVYEWQGKIERVVECAMFIKSHKARLDELLAAAKALHPYDLPALVVLPLTGGDADYLAWVDAQTRPAQPKKPDG